MVFYTICINSHFWNISESQNKQHGGDYRLRNQNLFNHMKLTVQFFGSRVSWSWIQTPSYASAASSMQE